MLRKHRHEPLQEGFWDENGQPVSKASIVIKGTPIGTSADVEGTFWINVKTGDVLSVSAVGIVAKEVTVTSASEINICLKLF